MILSIPQITELNHQFFYKNHFTAPTSKHSTIIKNHLEKLALALGRYDLGPVMYTLLSEMMINGVKAMHKNIYYHEVIKPIEDTLFPEKLSYTEWLKMFKYEIEVNQSKNLNRLTQQYGRNLGIMISVHTQGVHIDITNYGVPSEMEYYRIKTILEKVRELTSLAYLFDADDDSNEGAGLGIGLIVMTLKGLGVSENHFRICTKFNMTTSRLVIPFSIFNIDVVK